MFAMRVSYEQLATKSVYVYVLKRWFHISILWWRNFMIEMVFKVKMILSNYQQVVWIFFAYVLSCCKDLNAIVRRTLSLQTFFDPFSANIIILKRLLLFSSWLLPGKKLIHAEKIRTMGKIDKWRYCVFFIF